mmetsp:Transcript_44013/g.116406  ORF Transcript_44013/g.116406 Transcript_44013/m.116406 type:complete len:256 (-) Transcript_44013:5-772(-)
MIHLLRRSACEEEAHASADVARSSTNQGGTNEREDTAPDCLVSRSIFISRIQLHVSTSLIEETGHHGTDNCDALGATLCVAPRHGTVAHGKSHEFGARAAPVKPQGLTFTVLIDPLAFPALEAIGRSVPLTAQGCDFPSTHPPVVTTARVTAPTLPLGHTFPYVATRSGLVAPERTMNSFILRRNLLYPTSCFEPQALVRTIGFDHASTLTHRKHPCDHESQSEDTENDGGSSRQVLRLPCRHPTATQNSQFGCH